MPALLHCGFVDLRLLTFTLDTHTVTLHYFVRNTPTTSSDGTVHIDTPLQYYFLVREADQFLRMSSNDDWRFRNDLRSEQAVRTEVNNVVNTLVPKREQVYCTAAELKALKTIGILSYRAPHAMLITPVTLTHLLRHFGHHMKALIIEGILLHLTSEQRQLRRTILTLKSAIYAYNTQHGLPHDDHTTLQLMKGLHEKCNVGTLYPPPWAHHFSNYKSGQVNVINKEENSANRDNINNNTPDSQGNPTTDEREKTSLDTTTPTVITSNDTTTIPVSKTTKSKLKSTKKISNKKNTTKNATKNANNTNKTCKTSLMDLVFDNYDPNDGTDPKFGHYGNAYSASITSKHSYSSIYNTPVPIYTTKPSSNDSNNNIPTPILDTKALMLLSRIILHPIPPKKPSVWSSLSASREAYNPFTVSTMTNDTLPQFNYDGTMGLSTTTTTMQLKRFKNHVHNVHSLSTGTTMADDLDSQVIATTSPNHDVLDIFEPVPLNFDHLEPTSFASTPTTNTYITPTTSDTATTSIISTPATSSTSATTITPTTTTAPTATNTKTRKASIKAKSAHLKPKPDETSLSLDDTDVTMDDSNENDDSVVVIRAGDLRLKFDDDFDADDLARQFRELSLSTTLRCNSDSISILFSYPNTNSSNSNPLNDLSHSTLQVDLKLPHLIGSDQSHLAAINNSNWNPFTQEQKAEILSQHVLKTHLLNNTVSTNNYNSTTSTDTGNNLLQHNIVKQFPIQTETTNSDHNDNINIESFGINDEAHSTQPSSLTSLNCITTLPSPLDVQQSPLQGTKNSCLSSLTSITNNNPALRKLIDNNINKIIFDTAISSFTLFPALGIDKTFSFPFLSFLDCTNMSFLHLGLRFIPPISILGKPEWMTRNYPIALYQRQRQNLSRLRDMEHFICTEQKLTTPHNDKKTHTSSTFYHNDTNPAPHNIYNRAFNMQQRLLQMMFLPDIPVLSIEACRELPKEFGLPQFPDDGEVCDMCRDEYIAYLHKLDPLRCIDEWKQILAPSITPWLPCYHRQCFIDIANKKRQQEEMANVQRKNEKKIDLGMNNGDITKTNHNPSSDKDETSPSRQDNNIESSFIPHYTQQQSDNTDYPTPPHDEHVCGSARVMQDFHEIFIPPRDTSHHNSHSIVDRDYLITSGVVPFPTVFALALLYQTPDHLVDDITPTSLLTTEEQLNADKHSFNIKKSNHYTNRAIILAFKWLLEELKFPIAYSSALIEFDIETANSLYANDAPPVYFVPDTPPNTTFSASTHSKGVKSIDKNSLELTLTDQLCLQLTERRPNIDIIHKPIVKMSKPPPMTKAKAAAIVKKRSSTPQVLPAGISVMPPVMEQNNFPYEINTDTIPLFRSILFHLYELTPLFKTRLWRHFGGLFALKPTFVIRTDEPTARESKYVIRSEDFEPDEIIIKPKARGRPSLSRRHQVTPQTSVCNSDNTDGAVDDGNEGLIKRSRPNPKVSSIMGTPSTLKLDHVDKNTDNNDISAHTPNSNATNDINDDVRLDGLVNNANINVTMNNLGPSIHHDNNTKAITTRMLDQTIRSQNGHPDDTAVKSNINSFIPIQSSHSTTIFSAPKINPPLPKQNVSTDMTIDQIITLDTGTVSPDTGMYRIPLYPRATYPTDKIVSFDGNHSDPNSGLHINDDGNFAFRPTYREEQSIGNDRNDGIDIHVGGKPIINHGMKVNNPGVMSSAHYGHLNPFPAANHNNTDFHTDSKYSSITPPIDYKCLPILNNQNAMKSSNINMTNPDSTTTGNHFYPSTSPVATINHTLNPNMGIFPTTPTMLNTSMTDLLSPHGNTTINNTQDDAYILPYLQAQSPNQPPPNRLVHDSGSNNNAHPLLYQENHQNGTFPSFYVNQQGTLPIVNGESNLMGMLHHYTDVNTSSMVGITTSPSITEPMVLLATNPLSVPTPLTSNRHLAESNDQK